MESKEFTYKGITVNGFLALLLVLVILGISVYCLVLANSAPGLAPIGALVMVLLCVCLNGFVKLEPNEAKVLVFFGKYSGTFTKTGFYWINPLMSKKSVSLRARNLNPEPIKVNDKAGNPVMIGMVLVWKLEDTYKALFEIDSQSLATLAATARGTTPNRQFSAAFENFVRVQSDAALRQVAGFYAYDNPDSADELTLRSNAEEINEQLVNTLSDGRHPRGGGPHQLSRLCTGNRRGDAPPPAGGRHHRRPREDRGRSRQHGQDGPRQTQG